MNTEKSIQTGPDIIEASRLRRRAARTPFEFAPVEPWPEPVNGAALLDELERSLSRFVVLPESAPAALALWCLHTYAFELREVTPYLGIESPEKRCGKTTLLKVLQELSCRPVAAANISASAFFRVIAEVRPTLLIDEVDTFLPANEEMRGILNAGYDRQTAYVVRVAGPERGRVAAGKDPQWRTQPAAAAATSDGEAKALSAVEDAAANGSSLARFSCWCPKAIACIGRLPETLADRCILIRMQRKTDSESCERLRNFNALALRRQCGRFVLDHARAIAEGQPKIPADLNDRAADIWEPLLRLADLASGSWPARARQAALRLTAGAHENSPISALLLDILSLMTQARLERVSSHVLIEVLRKLPGRRWSEDLRESEITERWLAGQLRPYGVQPRTLRIGPEQAKGYTLEDLRELFVRYVPKVELEALGFRANGMGEMTRKA